MSGADPGLLALFEALARFIAQIGFPIVVALFLLLKFPKDMEFLRKSIVDSDEKTQKLIGELKKSVETLTTAIQLSATMRMRRDRDGE